MRSLLVILMAACGRVVADEPAHWSPAAAALPRPATADGPPIGVEAAQSGAGPLFAAPDAPAIERRPSMQLNNASLGYVGGDGLNITRTQLGLSAPVYAQKRDGVPDPSVVVMASATFGASFLDDQSELDLPGQLYTAGGGLRAISTINDRWKFIGALNIGYQGDGEATSDVVNLSGIGMLQWQKNERVQWMFGVVATGNDDLPVLPIVGLTWTPTDEWEISLGVPQTRVARRVRWFGAERDTWLYAGLLGVGGGSYAVQRSDGGDDLLTINEFPLALGLENRGDGVTWFAEGGVVVGRELEYEHGGEKVDLSESIYTRAGIMF